MARVLDMPRGPALGTAAASGSTSTTDGDGCYVTTLQVDTTLGAIAGGDGDYRFAAMREATERPALATAGVVLAMLGCGASAGLVPLHLGLPLAHSAAPSHVSALLSGVMLAISMANTGGAWDNTKKYIESGQFTNAAGEVRKKGSDEHKAAVIGDTVGDPLKDTSGPSLNILVKLMAIISLVFASGFAHTSFLAPYLDISQ